MRFSEISREISQQDERQVSSEYLRNYLSTPIATLERVQSTAVYYLYEDIISKDVMYQIEEFLGKDFYTHSNDCAFDALEVSMECRKVFGRKIKTWTDHSLKCFDNFLLRLIQEILNERVKKRKKHEIYETEVYDHLISKGGDLRQIGAAFKHIYQLRNTFQHIQIEYGDGKRKPKRQGAYKYNKQRDVIMQLFLGALTLLLKELNSKAGQWAVDTTKSC